MSHLSYTQTEIGLDVVILNDGSIWVTQSSYARFVGKNASTISRRSQELDMIEVDDISTYRDYNGKFKGLIKTVIDCGVNLQVKTLVVLIPSKIFGIWMFKDLPETAQRISSFGFSSYLYVISGKPQHINIDYGFKTELILAARKLDLLHNKLKKPKSKKDNKYVTVNVTKDIYDEIVKLCASENEVLTTKVNQLLYKALTDN